MAGILSFSNGIFDLTRDEDKVGPISNTIKMTNKLREAEINIAQDYYAKMCT